MHILKKLLWPLGLAGLTAMAGAPAMAADEDLWRRSRRRA